MMVSHVRLTRRQHKVPQWHLRKFTDSNGMLWCYRRDKLARPRPPKSVCWEFDFYEYEVNGYSTKNEFEGWLKRIENDASIRCRDILRGAHFGAWDAAVWATYVASLFLRSPKCREQIRSAMALKFGPETRSDRFIRDLQYEVFKKGLLMPADELRQLVESRRSGMENSPSYYHLAGIMNASKSLAESLMKKSWHTLEAQPGSVFLLGDCPVFTLCFEGDRLLHGGGFNNENAAVVVPLTPQHLFIGSPRAYSWSQVLGPGEVDKINLLSVQYARDTVFSSLRSTEIEALVNREINRVQYGRDGFIPRN